jgi:hypothetical protein
VTGALGLSFLQGSLLHGQCGIGNSPRMISCSGGDLKVARNGGLSSPSFDGGERLPRSSSGSKKRSNKYHTTSLCSPYASIVSKAILIVERNPNDLGHYL